MQSKEKKSVILQGTNGALEQEGVMQTASLRGELTAQLLMVGITVTQKDQDFKMGQVIRSKTELYPHKEIMVDKHKREREKE